MTSDERVITTTGRKIVRQYAFSLDSSSKEMLIEIIDKALDEQIEACARVAEIQMEYGATGGDIFPMLVAAIRMLKSKQ